MKPVPPRANTIHRYFQDGGLRHNNPINLTLWESRYIWPAIEKPDIVLSLGTGVEKESLFPRAPNFRNLIQDEFISRLTSSFISLLTGQGPWNIFFRPSLMT